SPAADVGDADRFAVPGSIGGGKRLLVASGEELQIDVAVGVGEAEVDGEGLPPLDADLVPILVRNLDDPEAKGAGLDNPRLGAGVVLLGLVVRAPLEEGLDLGVGGRE